MTIQSLDYILYMAQKSEQVNFSLASEVKFRVAAEKRIISYYHVDRVVTAGRDRARRYPALF